MLFIKKDYFTQFSNYEIFLIFKSNKRILLFLIEEGILTVDKIIASKIQENDFEYANYRHYFYPEIKPFIEKSKDNNDEVNWEDIEKVVGEYGEKFEEKRKNGENDNYICELIRNDSIVEFIVHINKLNIPLNSNIKPSIFETNPFLMKNQPTLIEYAAFFGSIQILNYLNTNNIELTSSLWPYAK